MALSLRSSWDSEKVDDVPPLEEDSRRRDSTSSDSSSVSSDMRRRSSGSELSMEAPSPFAGSRRVSHALSYSSAMSSSTMSGDITSHVEEVLLILKSIENISVLTVEQKMRLRYCMEIIAQNRLYEPIMQRSISSEFDNDDEFEGFLEAFAGKRDRKRSFSGSVQAAQLVRRAADIMRSRVAEKKARAASVTAAPIIEPPSPSHERLTRPESAMEHFQTRNRGSSVQDLTTTKRVTQLLERVHDCDFDIFEFKDACQGYELSIIVYHLFKNYQFLTQFDLSKDAFINYVQRIQDGYISTNPYHNATHAADVTQAVAYFLMGARLYETAKLTDLETMSLVFAAAIHDFQHPGLNNVFHVRAGRPLAILYNDRAVLENHHVAAAFGLLQNEHCNFLTRLSDEQKRAFRECVIAAVLSTDMSQHFKELGVVKSKLQTVEFMKFSQLEDRQLAVNMALHAADVSNPTRPLPVYLRWIDRVMEEFFAQGDEEKRLGLPVSMFMDRSNSSIPKCQFGFMDVIVQPLFTVFNQLLPDLSPACESLARNKAHFQKQLDEEHPHSPLRRRASMRSGPVGFLPGSPQVRQPLHVRSTSDLIKQ
eukprot:GILJ01004465.1.p1 GENE.GILJ01004465.1~~GILJ01004465.1.p1  ORF type:complete len:593 (-),score=94.86 GILJ01004465.1:225-2003(-)